MQGHTCNQVAWYVLLACIEYVFMLRAEFRYCIVRKDRWLLDSVIRTQAVVGRVGSKSQTCMLSIYFLHGSRKQTDQRSLSPNQSALVEAMMFCLASGRLWLWKGSELDGPQLVLLPSLSHMTQSIPFSQLDRFWYPEPLGH
jgi:hypothetical protein